MFYVHMFASPGWEDRGDMERFDAWLEKAKDKRTNIDTLVTPEITLHALHSIHYHIH